MKTHTKGINMNDKAREAFAEKIAAQGATYEQVTLSLIGYDAARAEYLPVVGALVDAGNALRNCNRSDFNVTFKEACAMFDEALALVAPLLGGVK